MGKTERNISYSVDCFMTEALISSGKLVTYQENTALRKIAAFLAKTERKARTAQSFRERYGVRTFSLSQNVISILEVMGVSIEYGTKYMYLVWSGKKFYKEFPEKETA